MTSKREIRRYQVIINNGAIKADNRPGLYERRFWIFAFGVILISILTRVFDFSLKPPSYKGLFITRPYYGLHSWASANRAGTARSHVKYGLGYTKGISNSGSGGPTTGPSAALCQPSLGKPKKKPKRLLIFLDIIGNSS